MSTGSCSGIRVQRQSSAGTEICARRWRRRSRGCSSPTRALLLGNRTDIDRFLSSANIFVLPSRWEGLPVSLLEAMGMGLPVVATRVEGVEEVVQDGVQGLLVPPEDSAGARRGLG